MNRGEIKQAVRDEMQLDPGLVSDMERNRFINYWLDDVGSWGLLEKVVSIPFSAGVSRVELPSGLIAIADVRLEGSSLRSIAGNVEGNGIPRFYRVEGSGLHLYPIPEENGVLELVFSYRPSHLTSDTQEPEVPLSWRYLAVLYVVFRAHKKNGNTATSREYQQEYEMKKGEKVREALQHYNSRVRVMWDSSQPLDWIDRLRL